MAGFISVIVPHLNQPEHLVRCLQSLARQTCPGDAFEVVVVDNGSKMLPRDIVAGFANARLEREETPGPGSARNRGVSASKGEILAFIDADCIADENWLATIAEGLRETGAKRILGGDVRIAVANPARLTQLEAYESVFAYRQQEYIEKQGFSGTGNLSVRREDFDSIGPFGGIDIAEDREWGQRATKLGYSISYVPEIIVYHPARTSFAEIFQKWDRHIEHDHAEYACATLGTLRWALYALAVALSPPLEFRRILASSRLSNARERLLATDAVIRVRMHRARRMFALTLGSQSGLRHRAWNR